MYETNLQTHEKNVKNHYLKNIFQSSKQTIRVN